MSLLRADQMRRPGLSAPSRNSRSIGLRPPQMLRPEPADQHPPLANRPPGSHVSRQNAPQSDIEEEALAAATGDCRARFARK